jgi:ParB family chromosome partitioning protein
MQIRMTKDRRYEMVPVDKVKVINSRRRDEVQFQMNVQSIDTVGLFKPVLVNDKFLGSSGLFELVCGEGRLTAHKRLGAEQIKAEVMTCSRKEAYLLSLIENLARSRPATMEFAKSLKWMHDQGWSYQEIGRVACKSSEYVHDYITLANNGEDRLIRGVEQGLFSISFAILAAQTDDANIQNVLMDAFDQGIVNGNNFARVRGIINARFNKRNFRVQGANTAGYTLESLVGDITNATKAKDSYVQQSKEKENRLLLLLDGIETLLKDETLVDLLQQEGLTDRPNLLGTYNITQQA